MIVGYCRSLHAEKAPELAAVSFRIEQGCCSVLQALHERFHAVS